MFQTALEGLIRPKVKAAAAGSTCACTYDLRDLTVSFVKYFSNSLAHCGAAILRFLKETVVNLCLCRKVRVVVTTYVFTTGGGLGLRTFEIRSYMRQISINVFRARAQG